MLCLALPIITMPSVPRKKGQKGTWCESVTAPATVSAFAASYPLKLRLREGKTAKRHKPGNLPVSFIYLRYAAEGGMGRRRNYV